MRRGSPGMHCETVASTARPSALRTFFDIGNVLPAMPPIATKKKSHYEGLTRPVSLHESAAWQPPGTGAARWGALMRKNPINTERVWRRSSRRHTVTRLEAYCSSCSIV